MQYIVHNIEYDIDEDNPDIYLPERIVIDIPSNEDEIQIDALLSDAISDITGYCHKGFSYEILENNIEDDEGFE